MNAALYGSGVVGFSGNRLSLQRDKPAGEDLAPDGPKPAGEDIAPDGPKPAGEDLAPDGPKLAREDKAPDGPKPAGEDIAPDGLVPSGRKMNGVLPPLRYTTHNLSPAFSLRYDWTGWPTAGTSLPGSAYDAVHTTASAWEPDGLRVLEAHATSEKIQILFSVTPSISPTFFCMRVKGRLQHVMRKVGTPVDFSRKVSFRSLGENTSATVSGYLHKQVGKESFADPRFQAVMKQFTVVCSKDVLAEPTASSSGRYWYNLHVVLVVADRLRITNPVKLGQLRDAAFEVTTRYGCRIGALAVMPDHLHVALRGNYERSPQDIALALQNGLAQTIGCRVWQDGFYVGTFSEYDVDVIRRVAGQSCSPAGKPAGG